LEFPVVFLAGMDEGIFPHSRSILDEDEIEEERRLCYVGITRARKMLYLTRAWQRNIYGNTSYYSASRFLNEIPQELLEELAPNGGNGIASATGRSNEAGITASRGYGAASRTGGGANFKERVTAGGSGGNFRDSGFLPGNLKPGDRVKHSKWGEGTVMDLEGMDEDAEITINFPSVGVKHLILKYAPIIKV
jgi:DNA helicase-2/ATP-dependent DNA helicase PcrA